MEACLTSALKVFISILQMFDPQQGVPRADRLFRTQVGIRRIFCLPSVYELRGASALTAFTWETPLLTPLMIPLKLPTSHHHLEKVVPGKMPIEVRPRTARR